MAWCRVQSMVTGSGAGGGACQDILYGAAGSIQEGRGGVAKDTDLDVIGDGLEAGRMRKYIRDDFGRASFAPFEFYMCMQSSVKYR